MPVNGDAAKRDMRPRRIVDWQHTLFSESQPYQSDLDRAHVAERVYVNSIVGHGTAVEILDQKRTRRTMRIYSAEQRMKAVKTFARFGCSVLMPT